jgi:hypothetical protein
MTCKHLASYHVIQLPVVRDDQVRFAYGILCTVGHLIAQSLAILSSFDNTVHLSQSPRCYFRPAFSAKAFLMNGVTVQLPISAFTLKRRRVMTYSQA